MHARFALFAGSALCLAFVAHCARQPKPPEVADNAPISVDASIDAGNEGGAGGEAAVDHGMNHALVEKALEESGTPTPDDANVHGLRFEVVEIGPNDDWAFAVVNRGSETMSVVFDPRLLTLEVEPPSDPNAKKHVKPPKPTLCRLPDELRPARADLSYVVELAPGHGLAEAFDPRLYCVSEGPKSPLVAGARVTATFGWEPKTKTVWKAGKRAEETEAPAPPFVAAIAPKTPELVDGGVTDAGADAGAVDAVVEASGQVTMIDASGEPAGGVKELRGTPFELGSDYQPPPKVEARGLEFELTRGSDAASESSATVTVSLTNHGSTPERVYFRRELVTLEVTGVDGTEVCNPGPDDRAPDRQAFTLLKPGGSITATSRLVEICPQDTFARPGLYLVRGAFDSDNSGARDGLNAFVGHLTADREVTVRIRTGPLPFESPRVREEVQVGMVPQP
ncbi:MAG TPA: hypothetical protein VMI54_26155 [Polyangiaceae bacterium]|nr:hypothetical protein [Polyangiaceae bacterium]